MAKCPGCGRKVRLENTWRDDEGDQMCSWCDTVIEYAGSPAEQEQAAQGKKPQTRLTAEGIESRYHVGFGKEREKIKQVKKLFGRLRNGGLPDMSDD